MWREGEGKWLRTPENPVFRRFFRQKRARPGRKAAAAEWKLRVGHA
jgi:hypothetical protein